jgi:polysaccharide export outer membrane protein
MRSIWMMLRLFFAALLVGGATLASAQPVAAGRGYVLGPDDGVVVSVFGQPDAGVTTRIKTDGTIVLPLIGNVKASGETVVSLAELITKKFVAGGFFKAPVVNVEIGAFVSKTVNVAGKVASPGVYPLDRTYHTLEMLLKAGWVRDQGATYIYLRRGSDYKETRVEVEGLVRGSADKDPILQPGDTLFVPDADMFYVYGQIGHPGTFPILPGMTIRQALAIAGGVTAAGASNKVGLYRAGAAERDDVDLDQKIQKNDVVFVKERLF